MPYEFQRFRRLLETPVPRIPFRGGTAATTIHNYQGVYTPNLGNISGMKLYILGTVFSVIEMRLLFFVSKCSFFSEVLYGDNETNQEAVIL